MRAEGYRKKEIERAKLYRVLAYETYTLKFLFGKRKPRSMQKFWPIGEDKKSQVTQEHRKKFLEKMAEFLRKKKKE